MSPARRVGSTVDVARLAAAVARPGIDPRVWCSVAYALGDSLLDEVHGDFVDVELLPGGLRCTARVPQPYAGAGFGASLGRVREGDELVVLFPQGDPAEGGVVVARLWSRSDPPPELAARHPGDAVLVGEEGVSVRLEVAGDGALLHAKAPTVVLEAPAVRLGSGGAAQRLVLGDAYRSAESTMHSSVQAGLATVRGGLAAASVAAGGLAAALDPAVQAFGVALVAALTTVDSGVAAVDAAVSAFEGQAGNYLSGVSKTD